MTRLNVMVIFYGIWAALYSASILVPYFTAPDDFGLTSGLNRVALFFQYQLAAGGVAIVLWWLGRRLALRWQRWLSRVPAILALALVVAMAVLILIAKTEKHSPYDHTPDPDRPVTAPLQPVKPVQPVRPEAND